MPKRLKTYRLDPGECAGFAAAVAETGETETEVLRRAILAYIQRVQAGGIASAVPIAASLVYTDVESPVSYDEPASDPPCRHPAEVVEAGECGICHADVF